MSQKLEAPYDFLLEVAHWEDNCSFHVSSIETCDLLFSAHFVESYFYVQVSKYSYYLLDKYSYDLRRYYNDGIMSIQIIRNV